MSRMYCRERTLSKTDKYVILCDIDEQLYMNHADITEPYMILTNDKYVILSVISSNDATLATCVISQIKQYLNSIAVCDFSRDNIERVYTAVASISSNCDFICSFVCVELETKCVTAFKVHLPIKTNELANHVKSIEPDTSTESADKHIKEYYLNNNKSIYISTNLIDHAKKSKKDNALKYRELLKLHDTQSNNTSIYHCDKNKLNEYNIYFMFTQ